MLKNLKSTKKSCFKSKTHSAICIESIQTQAVTNLIDEEINVLLCLWRPLPQYRENLRDLSERTDKNLVTTRTARVEKGEL